MSEIDAMKSIETSFANLNDAEKRRVLDWAWARYIHTHSPSGSNPAAPQKPQGSKSPATGDSISATPKKTKKFKAIPKQVKDLNLHPAGKPSAKAFAESKAPSNARQKCVVAVYYLRETIGVPEISTDHVFTFFKAVGWPVPADLANMLQQAGTSGWLQTADSQNILITPIGGNLIEHELPASVK